MTARKLTALTLTGSLKAGDSIYAVIDGNSRRVLYDSVNSTLALTYVSSASLATKQDSFNLSIYQTSAQIAGDYPSSAAIAATYATSADVATGLLTKQDSFNLATYVTSADIAATFATSAALATGLLTKQASFNLTTYQTSAQIAAAYQNSAAVATALLTKQNSFTLSDYVTSANVAGTYTTSLYVAATYATSQQLADAGAGSGVSSSYVADTYATSGQLATGLLTKQDSFNLTLYVTSANVAAIYATSAQLALRPTSAQVAATYATSAQLQTGLLTKQASFTLSDYVTSANVAGTYTTSLYVAATYATSQQLADAGAGSGVSSAYVAATYVTSQTHADGLLTKQASFNLTFYSTSAQIAALYATSAQLATGLLTKQASFDLTFYQTSAQVAGIYATSSQLSLRPTSAQVAATYATSTQLADGLLTKQASFNLGFYQTSAQVAGIYATSAALNTGLLTKQQSFTLTDYVTSANVADVYATSAQVALRPTSAAIAATYATSAALNTGLLTKQASFNLTVYQTSAQVAGIYATSAALNTGLLTKQDSFNLTFYVTSANIAATYPNSTAVAATYATSAALETGLLTKQASFNLGFYQTSAQVSGLYATSAQLNTGLLTKQASRAIGIANDELLTAKNSPNSGEIARFTTAGVEGLTESEFKVALNLDEPGVPQGRLTLTSGVPVLAAGVTAATTIYYTPYIGDRVPIYDGTKWVSREFTELSLALDNDSGHTGYQQSDNLYDLFVVNDAGTLRLGTGPAWTKAATITVTIATPAVVTWTAHGLREGAPIRFTTTGALPTGITAGTTYYVGKSPAANTFNIATTLANVVAGTYVATSGTQSGVHTGTNNDTSRGSGAGTTELTRLNGRLVNNNTMTVRFGSAVGNTVSAAANTALYVGTVCMTADGETEFSFGGLAVGGTEAKLFLWNMYNRQEFGATVTEAADSWTWTTNAWRAANGSASKRVTYVIGQDGGSYEARYHAGSLSTSTAWGVGYNKTSIYTGNTGHSNSASVFALATAEASISVGVAGRQYVSAIEFFTSGTGTFYGDGGAPTFLQTGALYFRGEF